MVAVQLKRLVSFIALCTLVSSSSIQRVHRADSLDNIGASQNGQSDSLSKLGPPVELDLTAHEPNKTEGNCNTQDSSCPPRYMNIKSPRSAENTNKDLDDNKLNSDAGSGELPALHLNNSDNNPIAPLIEMQNKSARADTPILNQNQIQDMEAVENHSSDGVFRRTVQMKRGHVTGVPIGEASINKDFQDGQEKTEGLGEINSEPQIE